MRAEFSFEMGADVRCARCGAERELPDGTAERVLEGDALYADVPDPCEVCGAKRIRVEIGVTDGPESGSS